MAATIRHTYTRESGGYTVATAVNGAREHETWTAGDMREASRVARTHEALIAGRDVPGCCAATARCAFHGGAR